MTALGKMLVFLVLVLSLAWNGLVLNAYVTRSNWRAEVKKAQDRAAEAAASAGEQRKLLDTKQEAAEEQVRVLRQERDALATNFAAVTNANKELQKRFDEVQKGNADRNDNQAKLQANVEALTGQVGLLTTALSEKQVQIDTLTRDTERAKANQVKAEIDAKTQRTRAEAALDQNRNQAEQLNELRLSRGGQSGLVGQRTPVPPSGLRGTVRTFDRSDSLMSLTPGLDAGLQVNAVLTVRRLTDGGTFLGTVRIISVDAKDSVGRFTPRAGLRAEEYPRPDDEVVPQ